ncbi:hypothetical protein HUF15_03995 [Streptomyces samsunensis]|uniref:DUF6282 family protein n=1 Tax=Streptomyces TaxID=1883 RepID=UPI00081F30E2|nr:MULTISPECIES: DUF6282 family protein [Streptomyces]MYU15167.1 hypothetical protein [Streptomyces sp. SID8361]AUA16420.1 hypothetical protein CFP59_08611 [Streptomyces sp. M56]MYX59226.1 hypothetical protein [Streptomyces sp. SID8382]NUH35934.1 hypothetical protein [Streptomyces samsunensis]SCG08633.1 hypothetical protein GA0115260_109419 [Streptomyces sp. MnatMP-M27]
MRDRPAIASVLDGLVDMHVHSGPSPFPRRLDHVEAAEDGARIGMRAMVAKSHHHNTQMDILAMKGRLAGVAASAYGGIALNSTVGGLNVHAVRMCLRMGGKVVWFPTISSGRHIDCHPEDGAFPTTTVPLTLERIDIVDGNGELKPEAAEILDEIKEQEAVVNGGHMYPEYIRTLFRAAKDRGMTRMVVSHPDYVIGADPDLCRELIALGAFIEHEVGMYDPEGTQKRDPKRLLTWIEALGPEHTVLASDFGQAVNPKPVDAWLRVAGALLDLGLPEKDLRRMVCDNPAYLLNLDT